MGSSRGVPNRSAYLAYIYLLRVPLLTWLLLLVLVVLGLEGSPMLRGLFDLTPARDSGTRLICCRASCCWPS